MHERFVRQSFRDNIHFDFVGFGFVDPNWFSILVTIVALLFETSRDPHHGHAVSFVGVVRKAHQHTIIHVAHANHIGLNKQAQFQLTRLEIPFVFSYSFLVQFTSWYPSNCAFRVLNLHCCCIIESCSMYRNCCNRSRSSLGLPLRLWLGRK